MPNLQRYQAKLCLTVAGVLIHDQKALLVKHKKLGFWLAPGGHVQADELPHRASEREFWEETGIKVTAIDAYPNLQSVDSEYLPNPFLTNLHWISEENYQARLTSTQPTQRYTKGKWKKGCEQHYCFIYLMKSVGEVDFKQNEEETDGIGWFAEEEVEQLDTTADIKSELKLAFQLDSRYNSHHEK